MTIFRAANRVKESTSSAGTGTINLNGADSANGFYTFVSKIGTGKRCIYEIKNTAESEIGFGVPTAGAPDTLSRDFILQSSNGGARLNLVGNYDVLCVSPAELFAQEFKDVVPIVNGTTTLTAADNATLFYADATAGNVTVAPPAVASVWPGFTFGVKRKDATANTVTVDPNGAETVDGAATRLISTQYTIEVYVCTGTEWLVITFAATHTISGAALNEAKATAVASAATTDIWNINGNYAHITGTTTITSFGTAVQAGIERTVVFDGALTLTNNANILLPGGANIATAAGDRAIVRADTTTVAEVVDYIRASGKAVILTSGSLLQSPVSTETGAVATGTTAMIDDDTIPQNTEGDQYMSVAITPKNASSILVIDVVVNMSSTNALYIAALFQDSTANALAVAKTRAPATSTLAQLSFRHVMAAGTTSATTFKVRAGGAVGTCTFNGEAGLRMYGGALASSIVVREYGP